MKTFSILSASVFAAFLFTTGVVHAAETSDFYRVPPVLVDDAIMPSPTSIAATEEWTRRVFAGENVEPSVAPKTCRIVVERQDYSRLRFNETCVARRFEFPNGVVFSNGLGSHANARWRVLFAEPVASFGAKLGIATNAAGGSIRGAVEASGKTVWQSEIVRGGDAPVEVVAKFDPPVSEFTLILDDAGDGPSCDQGNWLEPVAVAASGKEYALTDAVVSRMTSEVPFSFRYNGISSRDFLDSWTFNHEKLDALDDLYSWTDPKTRLTVSAQVRRFDKFAAADWVLRFTNEGTENSALIEDVQALDGAFEYGFEHTDAAIHTLTGDFCDENSWLPTIKSVGYGKTERFAPVGGRPSNGVFPFWNVVSRRYSDSETSEGLFVACGWSGQWNASFENLAQSQSLMKIKLGMEKISTILYPGETIRSPRVLVMPWRNDRLSAQVLFRRLLMFEYAPKIDGAPVQLEFTGQCFDRYYRKRPGWEKAPAQIESAKLVKEIGGTCYWFDAAWFPVGFPNGVGNWYSDPENFPNGVEELGDALEKLGMKFVLWFEPERVAPGTEIATKYPQYVFGGEKGGLYKLNDPEARKFLTELLLRRIREFKVGVFRTDFNIDPLPFWRDADAPDRVGMTEIRYVEGLYEMWDRIRAENPGLWIDDCASGGRRIDLETVSRSVPLWRSDTCCWPGHPEWDQNQTLGLTQYLPLYSCAAWSSDPYTFRSAANPGAIMQFNFLDEDYDPATARAAIAEAKENSKFWYGDFYPLTPAVRGTGAISAWQLHRPDLDEGVVYLFRQKDSPYLGIELELRALDASAKYRVEIFNNGYDVAETRELSGAELARYPFVLDQKDAATVVRYRKM